MKLPETVTFSVAFLSVFDLVCVNGYSELASAMGGEFDGSDDYNDRRDSICCDLSNAIGEARAALMLDLPDDAETEGALGDLVTNNWPSLADYLERTSS